MAGRPDVDRVIGRRAVSTVRQSVGAASFTRLLGSATGAETSSATCQSPVDYKECQGQAQQQAV